MNTWTFLLNTSNTKMWRRQPSGICSLVDADRRFRCAYHHIIVVMTEAVRTCERAICFYETSRRQIPEGCHLHTRRSENLKSQSTLTVWEMKLKYKDEDTTWTLCCHFMHLVKVKVKQSRMEAFGGEEV